MRILIVNYEYPPLGGGSSTATAEMAKWAAQDGHEVVVLTAAFRSLPRSETVDGYIVRRIPTLRLKEYRCTVPEMLSFMLSAIPHGRRVSRAFRPDVAWAVNGVPSGPVTLLLKKAMGIPYVVLLRDGEVPGFLSEKLALYHRLVMPLTKAIWRNASSVVANSEGLRELALRTTPELEIDVIPNGVDVEKFRPAEAGRERSVLRAVFLGRLSPQKGVEYLLEALGRLPKASRARVEMAIYGDGPERRKLEQLARQLSLEEMVEFKGWIGREGVPEMLRAADIFVLPSLYEGMSNALLEAMASGLAVVATEIQGSEELIRNGENGLLVPPRDAAALAEALGKIIGNSELRMRLGGQARKSVLEGRSWEQVTKRYLALSESAVAEAGTIRRSG